MSLTASAVNNPPHEASASRGTAVPVAILGLIALTPTLLSFSRVNWVETWTAAGMLVLIALYFILQRRLSTPASSVAFMVLFVAMLINFSPLSVRGTLQKGWTGSPMLRWIALGVPLGCAVLMAIFSIGPRASSSSATNFLSSLSIRLNLWLVACLASLGGLLLGGYAIGNIVPLALILATAAFALKPLLLVAENPTASRILLGAMAALLAVNATGGVLAYMELSAALDRGRTAAVAKNDGEAQAALSEALQLNERVQSRKQLVETHRQLGLLSEQFSRWGVAIHHWRQVSDLTGAEFSEHPAVRRILVQQGDSLLGWRQLVQQGFSSVMNDDLIPGFMVLGERPDADVRGTLTAALIRWEHGDAEKERRASLEKVIARRANDVSANTLLNVLGRPLPKEPLWLGEDLIVGTRSSHHSVNGAIQDLGTVDSLVFLTEGRWECRVQARGTPLNEEWPILRVEINGVEALRARVDKAESMQLPFAFDIKTRNLYRIRFVFENQLSLFQGNQQAFRSLIVEGVHFQRAGQ